MSDPCQSDLMPCGSRSGTGSTAVLDLIWGARNPYDGTYLQALADSVVCAPTVCYAWRQKWKWDCTATPHAWAHDGSADTVEVPCDQADGYVEVVDGCHVYVYGAPHHLADMPDSSDATETPTFPSVDDAACCPTPPGTQECQWYARFRYDEGTCTWVLNDGPTIIVHAQAEGEYCAAGVGSETGAIFISRYGPSLYSAAGHTCDEDFTSPPEGFDAPPIASVYYVACLGTYDGYNCYDDAVTTREMVFIAVSTGTACPETVNEGDADFSWPIEPGGQCVNMTPNDYSERLTQLAGPFCSYGDASAWASANTSMCASP